MTSILNRHKFENKYISEGESKAPNAIIYVMNFKQLRHSAECILKYCSKSYKQHLSLNFVIDSQLVLESCRKSLS